MSIIENDFIGEYKDLIKEVFDERLAAQVIA